MNPAESLKHTKWECKYHVVWMPKYRKKTLYSSSGGKTSQDKVSGREATIFQQSTKMRKQSVSTSRIRKKRTSGLSN